MTPFTQEMIRAVPDDELNQGSIEMICRGLVLAWLGADVWGHRVEEISRLEHELAEASGNLRQSLKANNAYEERLAKEIVEREITEGRVGELERRDRDRANEIAQLNKALEVIRTKNLILETENLSYIPRRRWSLRTWTKTLMIFW